jgi:hypothetical protein
MTYNSNIERQKHAGASKEEKARHNGVDTSRWGNDCPRIAVPEGWQDHQHTQQLIRKYIGNDFAVLNFKKRQLVVFLTDEERKAICPVEDKVAVSKYLYINETALGLCLEVRVRELNDRSGIDGHEPGYVNQYSHYEHGMEVRNLSLIRYLDVRNMPESGDCTEAICNIIKSGK